MYYASKKIRPTALLVISGECFHISFQPLSHCLKGCWGSSGQLLGRDKENLVISKACSLEPGFATIE